MIEDIAKILAEAAQSVLPMLLPKSADISVGEIEDWQPQAFPDPMVLITTNFSEGPSGSFYFLISTKGASQLVDLMLGGEGSADRSMNEESVDALKEMFNQILGVTATNLRDNYDSGFGFEQVEVHSLEAEMDLGLLLDDGKTNMVKLNTEIEGLAALTLMSCLPESTTESLGNSISGAGKEVETSEKAAPAATAGVGDDNIMQPPPLGDLPGFDDEEEAAEPPAPAEKGKVPVIAPGTAANIDLIMDIELPIVIRLGSTEMTLKEIMRLGPGAIIELNKGVDEPVELLVNNQTIAKGEVVVVEGNFAFRVTEIESRQSRIESLA
jgi:flagellar motor switch protein FliN